jgi:hypothetical protein
VRRESSDAELDESDWDVRVAGVLIGRTGESDLVLGMSCNGVGVDVDVNVGVVLLSPGSMTVRSLRWNMWKHLIFLPSSTYPSTATLTPSRRPQM